MQTAKNSVIGQQQPRFDCSNQFISSPMAVSIVSDKSMNS